MNALVALGFLNPEFPARVARWVQSSSSPQLASCSITELGFLRVLAQTPSYGFTVAQACAVLLRLKEARTFPLAFIPNGLDVSRLPGRVKAPKQITDGHLSYLAKANGALLATFGRKDPRFLFDTEIVFSLGIGFVRWFRAPDPQESMGGKLEKHT